MLTVIMSEILSLKNKSTEYIMFADNVNFLYSEYLIITEIVLKVG